METKHIGIAAVSAEGAALCYRTICLEGAAFLGPDDHPQVTMHTTPLAEYMRPIDVDDWRTVGLMLLASAERLVHAGADFVICPDNTAHQGLDLVREESPVPWLHIAEEVASVAAERGFQRLGILGTRYLMEGPVYPAKLGARGIGFEIPGPEDRARINTVIFEELVRGRIEAHSRRDLQRIIESLADRGCDAVVLGCTEIPLLLGADDLQPDLINPAALLAEAAVRFSIENAK